MRGGEIVDGLLDVEADEAVDGYVRRLEGSMICCALVC